jgi:ribonuclease D
MTEPEIVADHRRLADYCRQWREAGRFAFDTEFIRDESYVANLCLVQVADHDRVVLIDPTADLDVNRFWELVADESVATIVHAGKEDFEVCLHATGRPPRNVFDVQIAAGFVGLGYPLSLGRLVNLVFHRRIAKAQTLTNWLRRPLTPEQLHYAVEDVAYLPGICEHLQAKLAETGRAAWAREEFAEFEDARFYQPPIAHRLFKLKGTKQLDALGLAVLERLVAWRDRWARARNRPARSLMRDDVLVGIAKRRPRRPAELEVLRGFRASRSSRTFREILDVVKAAEAIPKSERPEPYKARDETPMTKATLDILSAFTRAVCHEEGVAHDLVGGAQRLRDLLDHLLGETDQRPRLLTGWREKFIGRRLVDLLEGRSELRLSGWPDNLRLEVMSRPPKP